MSSLWSELERVLAEVQKPARYIGCEDGMTVPDHHPVDRSPLGAGLGSGGHGPVLR